MFNENNDISHKMAILFFNQNLTKFKNLNQYSNNLTLLLLWVRIKKIINNLNNDNDEIYSFKRVSFLIK